MEDRDRSLVLIEGVDHVSAGLPVIDERVAVPAVPFSFRSPFFARPTVSPSFGPAPSGWHCQPDLRPRVDASKWPSDSSSLPWVFVLVPVLAEIPAAACFRPRGLSRRFSPWRSSSASVSVASEANLLVFKEARCFHGEINIDRDLREFTLRQNNARFYLRI